MPIVYFDVEFVSSIDIASQVRQFRFKLIEQTPFDYIAGQFITLHLPWQSNKIQRSYSIALPPKADLGVIEFAMSYIADGRASDLLFHLKPGTRLKCSGPFGRLILPKRLPSHCQRYLLIATGTGVTPYHAMTHDIAQHLQTHPNVSFHLLFGCRTQSEVLYESVFLALKKKFLNFNYTVSFSRQYSGLAPHQKTGYVQDHLNSLALHPDHDLIYLCGNPKMIDAAFQILKEKSFNHRSVKREKYISK